MSNTPTVQFYDNAIPSLQAGQYQIIAMQEIIDKAIPGDAFRNVVQPFEVRAPQFALGDSEIHTVYPPAQSSGTYGEILPHVVLNTRDLPWERFLTQDPTVPWMALLVFQEDELRIDPTTHTPVLVATVEQLLATDPDGQVLKPAITASSLTPEVLQSTCQSVILTAATFRNVVPRMAELKYLAHVRQVCNEGEANPAAGYDGDWFATVVANRLPCSDDLQGVRNWAFLVSLEGYAPYVEKPQFPKKKNGNDEMDVQLVALTCWSFVSTPAGAQSFAELVRNFVAQEGDNPERLLLRIPAPGSGTAPVQQEALRRVSDGYVPLTYRTAYGEETYAWYRGPLTPGLPQPLPKSVAPYASASEVTIYLQSTGLFDLSYAAAWEAGRAAALSDQAFATALLNLRRRSLRKIDTRLDQEHTQLRSQAGNLIRLPPGHGIAGQTAVQKLRSRLADPHTHDFLPQEVQEDLEPVTRWLAQLNLLAGIPFSHLVPDQRMLPAESIRFFHVDRNWLDCLTDGALSVGIESSRDTLFQEIIKEAIAGGVTQPAAGLVIRSGLVSGWPGLVVKGFRKGQPLNLLRMERLSPQILLCLFSEIPDQAQLSEPLQGLRFGAEDQGIIQLRSLVSPVGRPLEAFPVGEGFARFLRTTGDAGQRVLRINDGPGSLVPELAKALSVSPLAPAGFAVELVKAPEQQSFVLPAEVHHGKS